MSIPLCSYWDHTLQACKSTLVFLSEFEDRRYALIDKTIESLKELIQYGSDFDSLVSFHQESTPIDRKGKGKQVIDSSSSPDNIVLHHDPCWTIVDSKTIDITVEATGTVITAKAITTRDELKQLVSKMYKSRFSALDCEFISLKNALPQLQLLQVAISSTEGYAIVIDKVGIDALNEILKPCLEDRNLNFVGWAFRADAQAIESTMKGINLAPILDLQAKLRPIAVEEMNLLSGVTSYASDWDAMEQFQNAKLLGASFDYYGGDCIWLKDPLPPAALVYAVFDVVSLVTLLDATAKYHTSEEHFWPYTILKTAGRKSLNNWHKQRAISFSAPIVDTKELKGQRGKSSTNKGQRKGFSSSNIEPVDPDAKYEKDLQEALYLSLKQSRIPTESDSFASSSKPDSSTLDYQELGIEYIDFDSRTPCFAPGTEEVEEGENEDEVLDSTWGDVVNEKQKPFLGLNIVNQVNGNPSPSSAPITILKRPSESPPSTTEEVELTSPPAVAAAATVTPPETTTTETAESVTTEITTETLTNSSKMRMMFNEKPTVSAPKNSSSSNSSSNNSSNSNSNPAFDGKPDKDYPKDMKITSTGVASQTGTFGWEDDTEGAWRNFAQSAKAGWNNNVDTDPNTIDEIKPTTVKEQQGREEKFTTSINHVWHSKDVLSSDHNEWEVETEQPTVMRMQITNYDVQKTKGPRCINPNDIDFTDDDDESDEDESDDKKNDDDDDDKGSKNSTTSPSGSSKYYSNSQDFSQNEFSSWQSKGYSGNQYSRRPSYERNSRPNRHSRSYGYANNYNSYNNTNYNNNNKGNNNNSYQYNNYNHNSNSCQYNNNKYNTNNNNYNNYNNNNNNYSNNSNRSYKRNSGSSVSSHNSTPLPTPSLKQVTAEPPTNCYDPNIHVSDLYTNTGDYIKIFKVEEPAHVDLMILPSLTEPFTVAITGHLIPSKDMGAQLKAIQFYFPNHDSYNVIIGRACHENNIERTMHSKLTTLLTHPNINRVAWFPDLFAERLHQKTGIEMGRVVDLGTKAHFLGEEGLGSNFIAIINHYLKGWPVLEQFIHAKRAYDENLSKNKFVHTWDKDKIPDATLEYSALQGAALFKLYHHQTFVNVMDQDYIYKKKE